MSSKRIFLCSSNWIDTEKKVSSCKYVTLPITSENIVHSILDAIKLDSETLQTIFFSILVVICFLLFMFLVVILYKIVSKRSVRLDHTSKNITSVEI